MSVSKILPSEKRVYEVDGSTRPKPLVASDVMLQDFRFLPIDITRLFGSRFHAIASDSEWRAGVTLWLKSYHQVPAGSLPNDDIELARLAEFGRNLKDFLKVKQVALYGWIECADGRLYHQVVAEKVNEAWAKKQQQREKGLRGNAKRWGAHQKKPTESIHNDDGGPPMTAETAYPTGIAQGSPRDRTAIPQRSHRHRTRMPQASHRYPRRNP